MTKKINSNTIKKELRKLNLNPKDFFIYNDGVTIVVSASGGNVNCVEERQMHADTNRDQKLIERVQKARKVTDKVFSKFKGIFICKMRGHYINIER